MPVENILDFIANIGALKEVNENSFLSKLFCQNKNLLFLELIFGVYTQ